MSNKVFQTLKYINRRMKSCSVPKDATSCDAPERILRMAELALEENWVTNKRTNELFFVPVGNIWVSTLKRI